MRVVVTGAGGNLGRVLVPELLRAGHEVLATDFRPVDLGCDFAQIDVRDPEAIRGALTGADAVVHGAALHGVHLGAWSPHDYWSTNVDATFNLYVAASEERVSRVVLCSTMGVYGRSAERTRDAWAVVTEESPAEPTDVYGLTKLVCEELARHYARNTGVTTVALRLGMFVPETFERYGFRLLFGGVDDRDVASAVMQALTHAVPGGFDVFNVMAAVPFAYDEARLLAVDPERAVAAHWPDAAELARERALDVRELMWGWAIWRIDRAVRELGWKPRYGFGEFVDAWRRNAVGHYPFAELPQWGL